jgi:hypothetical protein
MVLPCALPSRDFGCQSDIILLIRRALAHPYRLATCRRACTHTPGCQLHLPICPLYPLSPRARGPWPCALDMGTASGQISFAHRQHPSGLCTLLSSWFTATICPFLSEARPYPTPEHSSVTQ